MRAPRGRMPGAATQAMPLCIVEERRRRRRPRAAATLWADGLLLAAPKKLSTKLLGHTPLAPRNAKARTRRPKSFFSILLGGKVH